MEVSGQLQAVTAFPSGETPPGAPWRGGCVGPSRSERPADSLGCSEGEEAS
jgi:hypothetical protein